MPAGTAPSTSGSQAQSASAERALAALRSPTTALRATAFWSAAVLPLAYLPFLAGVDVTHHVGPFLGLLALHLLSLVVGHDHANATDA